MTFRLIIARECHTMICWVNVVGWPWAERNKALAARLKSRALIIIMMIR